MSESGCWRRAAFTCRFAEPPSIGTIFITEPNELGYGRSRGADAELYTVGGGTALRYGGAKERPTIVMRLLSHSVRRMLVTMCLNVVVQLDRGVGLTREQHTTTRCEKVETLVRRTEGCALRPRDVEGVFD